MKCIHCGEVFDPYRCDAGLGCPSWVVDACYECHAELAHGVIDIKGVHLCGNGHVVGAEARWGELPSDQEGVLHLPREVSIDMPQSEAAIQAQYPEEDMF